MCGIVGVWAKEETVPFKVLDIMFTHNQKRGEDGWGFSIYNRKALKIYKNHNPYSKDRERFTQLHDLSRGNILIGICRAKPETEVATQKDNLDKTMQPIVYNGQYALVHNGSINTWYDECYKRMKTKIDSECILLQYQKYGFPQFIKHIIGGFAFLLLDTNKNQLIIGVNHMPLYHMYIRGVGYFVSSVPEALDEVLNYYYRTSYDTMNVWESWYHTQVEAFTVRSIDLESGFVQYVKFKPSYIIKDKLIEGGLLNEE